MKPLQVGQIVKGNKNAGLARGDVGVVVSTSLTPPRSVKVKFRSRGYWLIRPDELREPLEHDKVILTDDFINDAINDSKPLPSRNELIQLLGEALNHIDDGDLNNRISDAISRHSKG